MGYCMSQGFSKFKIEAKNIKHTVTAIKALKGSSYSWVDTQFHEEKTLEDLIGAWRWEVEINDNGDIIEIQFCGEKLGDDIVLFEAIAPFVKPGSYIQMHGKEGYMWRWVFDNNECLEIEPTVEW